MSVRIPNLPVATTLDTDNDYFVIDDGTTTQAIKGETVAEYTRLLPYGEVDNTSTSTAFTATLPGITVYQSGLSVVLLNNTIASASGCTLNINGIGAKPIYRSTSVASATNDWSLGSTFTFIYSETMIEGGCWVIMRGTVTTNTDTIAYNIRYDQSVLVPYAALYRYMICFTKDDTTILPVSKTSNSTGTSKSLTTEEFNPFMPIYYYSTTSTVSAGTAVSGSYMWTQHSTAYLNYAFNTGSTLVANKNVYVVIDKQSDGLFKLASSPISQDLPTTADGHYYLLLGKPYSTTRIVLFETHPIFYYENSQLKRL